MTLPRGSLRGLRYLLSALAGLAVFAATLCLAWSGFAHLWEHPSQIRDVLIVLIMAPFLGSGVVVAIALLALAVALALGGATVLWLWPANGLSRRADAVAKPVLETGSPDRLSP